MDSYPKVLLEPSGEWKPSYIDDDNQWEYFDDDGRSSANVYATRYTQYNDVLGPILSDPQYKPPSFTFTDDVEFTKGTTDDELFFDIPELDSR